MENKSGWAKSISSQEVLYIRYEDDGTENPWYDEYVDKVRSAELITDFNSYRCQLGTGRYDMRSDYRATSSSDFSKCVKRRLFKKLQDDDVGKAILVESEQYNIMPSGTYQSYAIRLTSQSSRGSKVLEVSETNVGKYLTIEVDYLNPDFPVVRIQDSIG